MKAAAPPTAAPPAAPDEPALGRAHAQRLREVYRSAGWPCQDGLELELLAAGMLQRVRGDGGHETLRLTEAGIALVAQSMAHHRAALTPHETLVRLVAQQMARDGRITWQGLALRAQVPVPAPGPEPGAPATPGALQWVMAKPDVFSIRNTSVAEYVEPIVHEVKVRRADLLGDLRKPAKRAAYLHLGECWYVLGHDARGRSIGEPEEIPEECGVMLARGDRLQVLRAAVRHTRAGLPFNVWMALAKATPLAMVADREAQGVLVPVDDDDGV